LFVKVSDGASSLHASENIFSCRTWTFKKYKRVAAFSAHDNRSRLSSLNSENEKQQTKPARNKTKIALWTFFVARFLPYALNLQQL